MRRVVVDTTIWVSALLFGGVPALAVEKAAANYRIAIAKEVYEEIARCALVAGAGIILSAIGICATWTPIRESTS